jgi:hypothetical protein
VEGLALPLSALAGVVLAEEGGFCFEDTGVCFGSAEGVDIQEPMVDLGIRVD